MIQVVSTSKYMRGCNCLFVCSCITGRETCTCGAPSQNLFNILQIIIYFELFALTRLSLVPFIHHYIVMRIFLPLFKLVFCFAYVFSLIILPISKNCLVFTLSNNSETPFLHFRYFPAAILFAVITC